MNTETQGNKATQTPVERQAAPKRTRRTLLGLLALAALTLSMPGRATAQSTAVCGDLNGDGKVTVADATLALEFAIGLQQPTAAQLSAGDISGTGKITVGDAVELLRAAIGATSLPTCTAPATAPVTNGLVTWVHVGDLHITDASSQNYKDLQTIVTELNQAFANGASFAVLPGDNANDGLESEYQLIQTALSSLKVPLFAVVGDHDLKSGGTQLFQKYIYPQPYYSQDIGGYHFVFLDAMENSGANELIPGTAQWSFLQSDLDAAAAAKKASVIVMHPFFLSQLPDPTSFLSLIEKDNVIRVDSGHTHTNDLANDGHIIYSATRSTGQDSEGAVGESVSTIDHGVSSWKFHPLGQWPFVEITAPADSVLLTNAAGIAHGTTTIDARAFSTTAIVSAGYQVDTTGSQVAMTSAGNGLWTGSWDTTKVSSGDHQITVTVKDQAGNSATDVISAVVDQTDTYSAGSKTAGPSGNQLGANTVKGLLTPSSGGGGPPPGGGMAPAGGGGNVPMGGPHGTATVVSVSGSTVVLQYADGTKVTLTITSSTQILKEVTGSISDLTVGSTVMVMGAPGGTTPSGITVLPAGTSMTGGKSAGGTTGGTSGGTTGTTSGGTTTGGTSGGTTTGKTTGA